MAMMAAASSARPPTTKAPMRVALGFFLMRCLQGLPGLAPRALRRRGRRRGTAARRRGPFFSSSRGGPSAVIVLRWLSRNSTRLATAKTLSSSCVTITTVVAMWSRRCRISSSSLAEVTGSRPAEGSSRNSSAGSSASARAMAARLRMPPLRSDGSLSKLSPRPTSASLKRASSARSRGLLCVNSCSGSITFSPTVIELHSAPPWNITPNWRRSCDSAVSSQA